MLIQLTEVREGEKKREVYYVKKVKFYSKILGLLKKSKNLQFSFIVLNFFFTKLFCILAILENAKKKNVILYVHENLPNYNFFLCFIAHCEVVRHMNLQALLFNRSYFHENSSNMAVFFLFIFNLVIYIYIIQL